MSTQRLTIRLSPEQIAYLRQHGDGDASRGLRQILHDLAGIGPIDRPRGMAAANGDVRARVASAGGRAKNRKV